MDWFHWPSALLGLFLGVGGCVVFGAWVLGGLDYDES